MYSLLDSTVLVSSSKPPRNWFARFNPNWYRFCKWNEKSDESKIGFGLSNGIRPMYSGTHIDRLYTGCPQKVSRLPNNQRIVLKFVNETRFSFVKCEL